MNDVNSAVQCHSEKCLACASSLNVYFTFDGLEQIGAWLGSLLGHVEIVVLDGDRDRLRSCGATRVMNSYQKLSAINS